MDDPQAIAKGLTANERLFLTDPEKPCSPSLNQSLGLFLSRTIEK